MLSLESINDSISSPIVYKLGELEGHKLTANANPECNKPGSISV
jgi:hypothetical protein